MECPIDNVKVDIPLPDVKIELGAEFIPRLSNLNAFGAGGLEHIDQEIIMALRLHAEHKERLAKLIASVDNHVVLMGGPPKLSEPPMQRSFGEIMGL